MPEGDTILRTARTLSRALAGRRVVRFASSVPSLSRAHREGHTVAAVEAHGKNVLVRFDDGVVLHTHMRMNGAWHLYRRDEPWRRPAHGARVLVEVEALAGEEPSSGLVAVCFDAPVVRLVAAGAAGRDAVLAALGPDVLALEFDAAEALRRLRAAGETPIGDALVAQGALAGIGNIYKSEALFAERVSPFAAVASLPDDALLSLMARARRMMQRNATGGTFGRRTVAVKGRGGPYAVYRRSGEPCLVCGAAIAMARQANGRSTYYCAACQGVRAPPSR